MASLAVLPGMFSASDLEQVRSRTDIVELVREHLPALKKAGRHYKALCPFHKEDTASFTVNPEKQVFHCFGCQAGGDVFEFVMKTENLGFAEAVERLAERGGVRVASARRSETPASRERSGLFSALEWASAFFRSCLEESPAGEPARWYLDSRGVSPQMKERFKIGFAPGQGAPLLEAGLRKGFGPALLQKAGLVALREGSGKYGDYFRNRIVFPIRNPKGEVVGFGGRVLGDGGPKYLNSPESPVFSKGGVLYGLFEGLSSVRSSKRAVLMEGYMDVVAAHQFGLEESAAPLGTALTEGHAAILKRYAEQAVVLFDPDEAGEAASLRGASVLLASGLSVRVARLKGGLDPDEHLHRHGVETFRKDLEASQDLAAFELESALRGRDARTLPAEERVRIATRMLGTLGLQPNALLRDEWLKQIAERLRLDEEVLRAELKKTLTPRGSRWASSGAEAERSGAASRPPRAEEETLQLLLCHPELLKAASGMREEDFSHPPCAQVYRWLKLEEKPSRPSGWTTGVLQAFPTWKSWLAALLTEPREAANPETVLAKLITDLKRSALSRRLKCLKEEIGAMDRGERPMDSDKLKEFAVLSRELLGRKVPPSGT